MQSDLSTFVPGSDGDPEKQPRSSTSPTGRIDTPSRTDRFDRCIAITDEGTRCSNEITYMQRNDFCGVHTRHEPRLTINDDPVRLIHALGRGSGNCWAIKNDGERCTYSTGPISVICGQHQSVDDPNLIQEADLRGPDDEEDRGGELNQILIAHALGRLGDVDVDLEDLPTDHD